MVGRSVWQWLVMAAQQINMIQDVAEVVGIAMEAVVEIEDVHARLENVEVALEVVHHAEESQDPDPDLDPDLDLVLHVSIRGVLRQKGQDLQGASLQQRDPQDLQTTRHQSLPNDDPDLPKINHHLKEKLHRNLLQGFLLHLCAKVCHEVAAGPSHEINLYKS